MERGNQQKEIQTSNRLSRHPLRWQTGRGTGQNGGEQGRARQEPPLPKAPGRGQRARPPLPRLQPRGGLRAQQERRRCPLTAGPSRPLDRPAAAGGRAAPRRSRRRWGPAQGPSHRPRLPGGSSDASRGRTAGAGLDCAVTLKSVAVLPRSVSTTWSGSGPGSSARRPPPRSTPPLGPSPHSVKLSHSAAMFASRPLSRDLAWSRGPWLGAALRMRSCPRGGGWRKGPRPVGSLRSCRRAVYAAQGRGGHTPCRRLCRGRGQASSSLPSVPSARSERSRVLQNSVTERGNPRREGCLQPPLPRRVRAVASPFRHRQVSPVSLSRGQERKVSRRLASTPSNVAGFNSPLKWNVFLPHEMSHFWKKKVESPPSAQAWPSSTDFHSGRFRFRWHCRALVFCLWAGFNGAPATQTSTVQTIESNQPSRKLGQILVVPGSCWPLLPALLPALLPLPELLAGGSSRDFASWRSATTSLWWPRLGPSPVGLQGTVLVCLPERGSALPRQHCCRARPHRAAWGLSLLHPVFPTFSIFLACVCSVCPVLCCAKHFCTEQATTPFLVQGKLCFYGVILHLKAQRTIVWRFCWLKWNDL